MVSEGQVVKINWYTPLEGIWEPSCSSHWILAWIDYVVYDDWKNNDHLLLLRSIDISNPVRVTPTHPPVLSYLSNLQDLGKHFDAGGFIVHISVNLNLIKVPDP